MLVQVSTPTSAAELRALYRRTRAHFASARPAAAATPVAAAASPALPTRILAPPPHRPHARFSGRATVCIVARHFGIPPAALTGAARLRRLVVARWIVMRICVEVGGYTAARAGRLLGRDHTTVLYGLRELAALLARDAALTDAVARLMRQCVPEGAPATAEEGGA